MTDISVSVPEPEPEAEPETPDVVVVNNDAPTSSGVEGAIVQQLLAEQSARLEAEARVAELEAHSDAQDNAIAEVAAVADDAAIAAGAAVEIVAEQQQEETHAEHDAEPRQRTHGYWRTIGGHDE